jgi:site-specific DNA recombinase
MHFRTNGYPSILTCMSTKRAAVYTRLSVYRGAADPTTSPERQRESCQQYALAKGWVVVQLVEDLDVSGSEKGDRLERPGIQQLRRLWDEIDVVVVPKLDRLARSVVDFHLFAKEARQHGVDLVSVQEGLDLTTASGRFVATIIAAFAEMEAETIAERTRAGRWGAAALGRWTGGPVPYGYRPIPHPSGKGRSLDLEPAEAAAIRQAAAQVLDGVPLARVARWLNQHGPPPRRGGQWQRTTLYHILTGEAVRGRITMGGKLMRGADGYPLEPFPAVLTAAESDRLREALLPTTTPTVRYGARLLSGLLRCAGCGGLLSTSKGSDGKQIYRCYASSRGGLCPHPVTVSADAVEAHVAAEFLSEMGDLPLYERQAVGDSGDLTAVEEAISATLAELAQLATPELFARLQTLQADRERTMAAPAQFSEAVATGQTIADAWADTDITGRRRMLADHYRELLVRPGRGGRKGFDPSRLEPIPEAWFPPQ